jgi:hypothetical protein
MLKLVNLKKNLHSKKNQLMKSINEVNHAINHSISGSFLIVISGKIELNDLV